MSTDAEQQWEQWWASLPADEREKIESYEASIGTRLTWANRYMLHPGVTNQENQS